MNYSNLPRISAYQHLETIDPRSKSLQRVICLVARSSVSDTHQPGCMWTMYLLSMTFPLMELPTPTSMYQDVLGHTGTKKMRFFLSEIGILRAYPGPFSFCWLQTGYSTSLAQRVGLLRIPIVGSVVMMNAYGRWMHCDHAAHLWCQENHATLVNKVAGKWIDHQRRILAGFLDY